MALSAELTSGAYAPVRVSVEGIDAADGPVKLFLWRSSEVDALIEPRAGWRVVSVLDLDQGTTTAELVDDGRNVTPGMYLAPPIGVPLTYQAQVQKDGAPVATADVVGTPVVLRVWPDPRLSLTAEQNAADRSKFTFTIKGGKTDSATLDPGDGGNLITVPLTGGEGRATYGYTDPGHHTYRACVTVPAPVRWTTWERLGADIPNWAVVPDSFGRWDVATLDAETACTEVSPDVGKATIWAEPHLNPWPYAQITAWIGDPDDVQRWTIERIVPDSPPDLNTVIFVTESNPAGLSLEDNEIPLGVPVVYRLHVLYKNGTTYEIDAQVVTLDGTRGCFLTSTGTGQTMPVQVQSWSERARAARQALLEIQAREDPVVLSDVHTTPSSTLVFLTRTRGELVNLRAVLTETRLCVLRTQPSSSLETVYFAVGNITEGRLYPGRGDRWERLVQVEAQEVAPVPATARLLHVSWEDVGARWATWADVGAAVPTWQDLAGWNPERAA
ncbi:hypothetical protein [Yinghuangia soli]|uniref:Uncharacterized protein n=1 Tax=Yinghuangia soli TaxID=2908204 RepID=A0AA41Q3F0_9ACTN|nr:hypothetical protein [Yinghuangia soli]MCF2529377.1 hypothetical protein [Yinghuangia soli]